MIPLSPGTQYYQHPQALTLESGGTLHLTVAYHTWGQLNAQADNCVWVLHALTANSDVTAWWPDMIGPPETGALLDPQRWFIVCANMVGSCYGSTGPRSTNPATGQPWGADFPLVTVRDQVQALMALRHHLGVQRIALATGGSMGGMQGLEWCLAEPGVVQHLAAIATNAVHSPWGRAWNETQRMALTTDPTFTQNTPTAGRQGMATARAMGMLSYRHYHAYGHTQPDAPDQLQHYRAPGYQRYQGQKLVQRFHAHAYWALTRMMDSHDVGRFRGGTAAALAQVQARTLVVGISSDVLFPVVEQQYLAQHIPGAVYHEIDSPYGHDGFLVEGAQLRQIIRSWWGGAQNP